MMRSAVMWPIAQSCRPSLIGALGVALLVFAGCGASPEDPAPAKRRQQVPIGGACTDNTDCDNFDDDTRLIICNVPAGMMAGVCYDCWAAAMNRPVGCFCSADAECAAPARCNGRTCQIPRARGEFCVHDTDCAGSDALGAIVCLPTKSYCGPGADGYFCDFDTDCVNNNCNDLGVCTSGMAGDDCTSDAKCKAPTNICYGITFKCIAPLPDGSLCTRDAECATSPCNSFSGQCMPGPAGTACTRDGDCDMGLVCTDCGGGARTCRAPMSPCD
jgi:hypothetical protein